MLHLDLFAKNKVVVNTARILALPIIFCSLVSISEAASLFLTPNNGSYTVGQNFTLSINVESADQAINAVSGTLSFNPNAVEVVSLSKAGSIISLWPVEPSFSNTSGTISFEGIALNPGFRGSQGKVLNAVFKPKLEGQTIVNFLDATTLANDGQGTNVISGTQLARITVKPAPPVQNIEDTKIPDVAIPETNVIPADIITEPEIKFTTSADPFYTVTLRSKVLAGILQFTVNYLPIILLGIVGIVGIIFLVSYIWHRLARKLCSSCVQDETSHKVLIKIEKDLSGSVKKLRSIQKTRVLTVEESTVLTKLEKSISKIQKISSK